MMKKYPTIEECEKLWLKHNTPKHVIGHCKEVSRVATILAEALSECGVPLNVPLVQSAGWLHDIKRVEELHWEKGAQIAYDLGYDDIADLILVHMSYRINGEKRNITELDVLCLADRMVLEDKFVGLDLRMDYIINKSREDKSAEERIRKSFSQTKLFLKYVETLLGRSLFEIMK
ncbi:HD domain-containing protein [Sinanaerobacter sp. ZZT-01]|uniref:HD domain-containing protein n=1 Tax=Sinanaerobacter sp. ZZT-01 TaxID=3111540 RepID=UPI002D78014C|nr:HD domain-containing protein [Sinanaerobacter sp. ZZT-01]WRR93081.1 HD domain-containing protein [Sinanaerobacter sp. ZZT-01]